jgi:hypothetical protein
LQSGRGDIRPPPPQPLMSATPQGFANQQQQRGGPQGPNQNQRMPMMSPFGMPPMGMAPPAGMHQGGFPAQGFPHGGMGPPQGMGGLPQGMAPGPGMQGMPPGMPMMPFGFQQFPNQGTVCIILHSCNYRVLLDFVRKMRKRKLSTVISPCRTR